MSFINNILHFNGEKELLDIFQLFIWNIDKNIIFHVGRENIVLKILHAVWLLIILFPWSRWWATSSYSETCCVQSKLVCLSFKISEKAEKHYLCYCKLLNIVAKLKNQKSRVWPHNNQKQFKWCNFFSLYISINNKAAHDLLELGKLYI